MLTGGRFQPGERHEKESAAAGIVFLFGVDNTLLDNDRVTEDCSVILSTKSPRASGTILRSSNSCGSSWGTRII
jgi:hypothetical protein